jgi:anti-anti-sigma regulatory factor
VRELDLRVEAVGGSMVMVSASGVLDSNSYFSLRSALLKAAAEQPSAVLVDVDALRVPVPSAWSVLTSAQWMVDVWLGVPICVVTAKPEVRKVLRDNGITRYVPVFPSRHAGVDALAADAGARNARRSRVSHDLPRHAASQGLARELVRRSLTRWHHIEYVDAAQAIVTELVRNVLAHTRSAPRVRLELDGDRLTIAVADHSTRPAVRRESGEGRVASSGLGVVAELSYAWGSHATDDGKVVWATIRTGGRGRSRTN